MRNINQENSLRERLYRARIKFNFYGGMTLGAIAPIAAARYGFLPKWETGSYALDAFANSAMWASAAIATLPAQIVSIPFGACLGTVSCFQLADNRRKRESKLKEIVN